MNLSKSSYTKGVQCPKMLWMDRHMPERFDNSVLNESVLATGSEVGDLAMGYYGEFVEVPFDGSDLSGMVAKTQALMDAGVRVICEATFSFDGCLCMVDILRVEDDGVHIVEVKSATSPSAIYYHDMAFQTWVLTQCGLKVKTVSLMYLNNQYVRHGALDLQELFTVEDSSAKVVPMVPDVETAIADLKEIAGKDQEPDIAYGPHCKNPYECGYRAWCWRDLPTPSVFDLCRMQTKKALKLKDKGIVSFQSLLDNDIELAGRQMVQVICEVNNEDTHIDEPAVRLFLNGLCFPLYFLDFETFQPAIPPFDGVRPYQQIPTQYSLHVLREPNGELEHYEFLAQPGCDPRRDVAEHLVADIPAEQGPDGIWSVCGTTLAYNMGFEKGRIKELAELFPDLSERLLAINKGMSDLIKPFESGAYYARAMGGANTIKRVLPALFPDDSELDYHGLEGVHNGSEAMSVYAGMANMEPGEAERTRENLLRYCELDTYAMVKIWRKLVDAVAGE